jgi:hypothetical protein
MEFALFVPEIEFMMDSLLVYALLDFKAKHQIHNVLDNVKVMK